MTDPSSLQAAARAWMQRDPDPATRAATEAMLDDPERLNACFGGRLSFGTAGMRGPIGPGPNCMNRAVVRGVARAVGRWVGEGSVVIGFDGRVGSRAFAEESASILGGSGLQVWLFDEVCPTPELSFAARHLQADAAIMVTASHNPPRDNGYKVYDATGTQIVPDEAEQIAALWSEDLHPAAGPELSELRGSGRVRSVPESVGQAWLDGLMALRVHPDAAETPVRIVYTAMHGVGTARVLELLARAGHTDVYAVPEQRDPDGAFPTVSFPNPEEPGAMDLALAAAAERGADLILANDPDADRLAVGVPSGDGFRMLTGNEVGWLLGEDLLANRTSNAPAMVATTVVSSGLLRQIAEHHGATYGETLTGFKWIGRLALDHEERGGQFVLGYEESLGYLAGGLTRDKDGVGAALLFADLAADCKATGGSILDRLADLHHRHGYHGSSAHSVRLSGADARDRIDAAMGRLRSDPPTEIGGRKVLRFRDVLHGTALDTRTGQTGTVHLPSSNLLAWDLEGGRALARPSGTEPKFKLYYEVVIPTEGADPAGLDARARPALDAIRDDLLHRAGLT